MSSVSKRKLTVKSDIWFVDKNVFRTRGFHESPLFGTQMTQFYWRVEKCAPFHTLYLYLAACKEETIHVQVKIRSGLTIPLTFERLLKGEISLDKTRNLMFAEWSSSFFISTEITFDETDVATSQITQQKHYEELASQLTILRENRNSADITLVTTVDGREFSAHKWILASRSTVFAAMFQHDNLVENKTNQVEIDDVTGEVMDALLRYIYSADLQGIEKMPDELLQAADKYDIPLLVGACVESLQSSLSIENALRFFILADLHHLEVFKEEIVKFIEPNIEAIRESADWKKYINMGLLQQLFDLLFVIPKN